MQIYFRDHYIDESQARVSINDRSFRFGDGVFETVIIAGGRLWDWAAHERRLTRGLAFYKIDIGTAKIPKIAQVLIKKNNIVDGYLRVVISRGETNVVGYAVENPESYMVVSVSSKPLPEYRTIKVIVSEIRGFYASPCKTNNALLFTRMMMEAAEAGYDNALMLSHDGFIAEMANANLFWIKGDVLFTPSLDLPLIPGTLRERVLSLWQGEKKEGRFRLEELESADEIFMANVGGIITSIGEVRGVRLKAQSNAKTAKLREAIVKDILSA